MDFWAYMMGKFGRALLLPADSPIIALVGLTGVVCALMAAFRNLGILRGLTSPCDYIANQPQHGVDWIERPARTFNNLLQMPTLFYLVCVLMMLTHRVDQSSLTLAWTFVALRAVHAVIYIGWNTLHYRFGTWFAGCIVLATLWVRFAMLR